MRPSWKYTRTYKELQKRFSDKECNLIGDALFIIFHPMSDFFEKDIQEKIAIVQENILSPLDISYDDLEEEINLYKKELLTREVRNYNNLVNLIDYTMASCERIRGIMSQDKVILTREMGTVVKEITNFASKYSSLKEQVRLAQIEAKRSVKATETYGKIALSPGDARFID